MTQGFENPFAGYGKVVCGDRFIGRKESLRVIESRINPHNPANLAIIGQPRSGKSSLVHKALIERKDEFVAKKLIPIKITCAIYKQSESEAFFQVLVNKCLNELENLDEVDERIRLAADRACEHGLLWNERYSKIQRFFGKVQETGYHILFILDEFDNVRNIFRDNVSDFQKLRELAYQPEFGVILITTSRRSIETIELQVGDISTLSGIFQHYYLGMFEDEDIQVFFNRLEAADVELSEELKSDILSYCGGYPYLLDMLGCEIVEMRQKGLEIKVQEAVTRIAQSLFKHYNQIVNLLKEDKNLPRLIQILFGPVIDVEQATVNEFLRYGLIRESEDGMYEGFSTHFHDFLRLMERKNSGDDLWPIWRDTEKALRQFITTTMLEQYGESWVENLEKRHPRFHKENQKTKEPGVFEQCRFAQQKDTRIFGNRASQNLIDYTYPQTLFEIIFAEWNSFQDTFGNDKQYWSNYAQHLSKIRNPLAHNRYESFREHELKIAEGYCEEILAKLEGKISLETRVPSKDEENQ